MASDPQGAEPRPRKQEKEPATTEISEVGGGVLRSQLPISMPGLGHVNMYLLPDSRGVAVVDPGLPGYPSWRAVVDRLKRAGYRPRHVHTVIVTHSHPDHFGGAGTLRDRYGARVVTHESFRTFFDANEDEAETVDSPWSRPLPWRDDKGFEAPQRKLMHSPVARRILRRWMRTPRPTQRLADAEVIRLADREWVAVHTPGHTIDHLCLFDPAEGVLLSGDHVLPTITPHISGIGSGADPLAAFFASLDRVAALEGVTVGLPAHGHPMTDPAKRARQIREHHEGRLALLTEASAEARADHGRRALPPVVPPPIVGIDGRERDLRPPRAPPGRRPGDHRARRRGTALRTAARGLTPTRGDGRRGHHIASRHHPQRKAAVGFVRHDDVGVGAGRQCTAVLDPGPQRSSQVAATGELLLDRNPVHGVVDVAEHVEVAEAKRPRSPEEPGWRGRQPEPRRDRAHRGPRTGKGPAVDCGELRGQASRAARFRIDVHPQHGGVDVSSALTAQFHASVRVVGAVARAPGAKGHRLAQHREAPYLEVQAPDHPVVLARQVDLGRVVG